MYVSRYKWWGFLLNCVIRKKVKLLSVRLVIIGYVKGFIVFKDVWCVLKKLLC